MELSFAAVTLIDEPIVEIITHGEVEINTGMIEEIEYLLNQNNLHLVMINAENEYSFSFDAILAARKMLGITAMAICSEKKESLIATRTIHGTQEQSAYAFELFDDRSKAIEWLRSFKE